MPTLMVVVDEQVWPTVAGVLAEEFGAPDGVSAAVWANSIAARIFSERLAQLMRRPPERPAPRIRPSRVRS